MTELPIPVTDIAANRPGDSAQAQADVLKAQVPGFKRFLQFILNVRSEWKSWAEGAEGERLVARELEKLCPGWKALHAVPVGDRGSDIDHVVIGPGGVFTVNAKHHWNSKIWVRDKGFTVNGHKQPYVRNSVHEATRAAKLLTAACGFPVPAAGVISVVCQREKLDIREQPQSGVRVEHYKSAAKWIQSQERKLTDGQIEAVYAAARIPATWAGTPKAKAA